MADPYAPAVFPDHWRQLARWLDVAHAAIVTADSDHALAHAINHRAALIAAAVTDDVEWDDEPEPDLTALGWRDGRNPRGSFTWPFWYTPHHEPAPVDWPRRVPARKAPDSWRSRRVPTPSRPTSPGPTRPSARYPTISARYPIVP